MTAGEVSSGIRRSEEISRTHCSLEPNAVRYAGEVTPVDYCLEFGAFLGDLESSAVRTALAEQAEGAWNLEIVRCEDLIKGC